MKNYLLKNNFLTNAEEFFNTKFSNREIISDLITFVIKHNNINNFEKLIFLAKYVNGLFKSINSPAIKTQLNNFDLITKELSENLDKIRLLISTLIKNSDESFKQLIENQFLEFGNIQSKKLLSLIEDLSLIKKYLNYLKRIN